MDDSLFLRLFRSVFQALLWSLLLCTASTPVAYAKDAYGYMSLTAEMSPDTSSCLANESLFDVVAKEYNTEVIASVQSISIEVRDRATNGVIRIGGGAPQTAGLCMDPVTQYLFVTIIGGTDYHDLIGTYGIDTNPSFYVGRHIRAHAHVAASSDGPSIRHRAPIGTWSNQVPTAFSFDVLSMPTIHGGSGLYNINLTVSSPVYNTIQAAAGGLGTYTLTVPGASLSDGWLGWGFYVGLNGGAPNPISAYSGTESFGLDRQPPQATAVRSIISPLETEQVRFMGLGEDQLTLSGLMNIRLYLDGTLVKTCTYAAPNTQGPTIEQQCDSALLGPFSSGSTHTHDVVVTDTAGNSATSSDSFVVGCNKAIGLWGVNPGQFKGCLYKTNNAGVITGPAGDAPNGPPLVSGATGLTTLLDVNWGGGAPNALTGDDHFKGEWVGTQVFPPGQYAFYHTGDDCVRLTGTTYPNNTMFWYEFGDAWYDGSCNNTLVTAYKSYPTTTTQTIQISYREALGNARVKVEYRRLCDDYTPGINQFTGCLYGVRWSGVGAGRTPIAPAPASSPVSSPVPASATALSFDFGTMASPDLAWGGTENYSLVYNGSFFFPAGTYKFTAKHDDDMKVTIGTTTMDAMTVADAGVETDVFYHTFATDQRATIGIDYSERTGVSQVSFGWEKLAAPPVLCDTTRTGTNRFEGCAWNGQNTSIGTGISFRNNPEEDSISAALRTPDVTATSSGGLATVATTYNALNMNWGMSSPAPNVLGNNTFYTEWKGNFTFMPGTYTFFGDSDDRFRVYVDGVEMCEWYSGWCGFTRTFTATTTLNIRLTNSHADGAAYAIFGWSQRCLEGFFSPNQFTGCLYAYGPVLSNLGANEAVAPQGPILSNPVPLSESAFNFNWGIGVATPGYTRTDFFGARYWGAFYFPAGTYKFTATHDDGLRVFIGSTLVLDAWKRAAWGNETDVFYYTFPADQWATSTIEYFEYNGTSSLSLRWERLAGPPVRCDTTRTGINRFEGCLYNDALPSSFSAPPTLNPARLMLDTEHALLQMPDVTDPATGAVLPTATPVNVDWRGLAAPYPLVVGPQTYAVHWKGNFTFAPGEYTFWHNSGGTNIWMNGVCLLSFTSCNNFRQFATTTTVNIQMHTAEASDRLTQFGWVATPKALGARIISPTPEVYGVFPGYVPAVSDVRRLYENRGWTGSGWYGAPFNNRLSAVFPTVTGVTSMKLTGEDDPLLPYFGNRPHVVANSGAATAYIELRDPTANRWNVVWSRPVTTIPHYFTDPSSFVTFPKQDVNQIRYSVSPVPSGTWTFYDFYPAKFSFAGPGVNATSTSGYQIRNISIAGFEDTVNVDGVVPAGITKIGAWPKTCVLTPFGICDVYLLLTTASSSPFTTYSPIVFTSTGVNTGQSTTTRAALRTWGFDLVVTPTAPQSALPGTPMTYDVNVTSRNGWGGTVTFAASTTPADPTLTTAFVLPSIFLPSGGTATTAVQILSSSTTPERSYRINVSATGQSPEGPYTRYANPAPTLLIVAPSMLSTDSADLVAQELTVSTAIPTPGQIVTFSGLVSNYGGATASSTSVARFCVDDPDCLTSGAGSIGDSPVPTLNSGDSWSVTSPSWTATAGMHTIYLCSDVNDDVSETDETNNCQSIDFLVAFPVPDLTISVSPSLNTGILAEGNTVTFKGTVMNIGGVTAAGTYNNFFKVDIDNNGSLDVPLPPHPTASDTVSGGEVVVISGAWTNIPAGTHRVSICADQPSPVIAESDEGNNCSSVTAGIFTVTSGGPPALSITPVSRDFGDTLIDTQKDRSFTITNTGGGTLTGSLVFPAGPFTCSTVNVGGCDFSLSAGESIDIWITFNPTTLGTTPTYPISVISNTPTQTISVWGTGVSPVSGSALDFGRVQVDKTKDLTLTITNTGSGAQSGTLNLPAPFICVASSAGMTGSLCNYNLAPSGTPGDVNTLTIRFAPLVGGAFTGSASLSGDPTSIFELLGIGYGLSMFFKEI